MTLDEINKIRAITGDKPLTRVGVSNSILETPSKSLSERLGISKVNSHVEPIFKANTESTGVKGVVSNLGRMAGNVPSDIAGTIEAAVIDPAKKFGQSANIASDIYKDKGFVQGTKDIAAGTGETLSNIFQAPGKAVVGLNDKLDLINHLSPIQDQAIKQRDTILQKIDDAKKTGKDTSSLIQALKIVQENLKSLDDQIGSKEDRQNKGVEDLTNIAKYPIEHPVQTGIAAATLAPEAQETIAAKIKPVTSKIEGGTNFVKDEASNVVDRLKPSNIFKTKTQAEILATPEDKLHKLTAPERKLYFDTQAEAIAQKSKLLESKVKENLIQTSEKTQAEAESLKRELDVASRDEVIKLRPKIVKAMGEQSKTYRNLIDEEMAGKENIPIKIDDLKTHIDTKFGENPALATAIKEKLGLTEAPEVLKKGQLPTIQSEASTKTLGELYEKTKSLKQEISTGATKGSKVFTSEDKLTDDAIHTLTDFMKKNGVDFSQANKFWSKYAPIRNQLVSEAKPFLQTETQTKTFANTLTRVAKGTDVNNENFIKEVENLLGEPIAKDTKAVLKKLTEKEKQAIAQEAEALAQKAEIQLLKEKELKKLSDRQFKIEQKAYRRKIIRNVIIGTIGGGALFEVGKKVTEAAGL